MWCSTNLEMLEIKKHENVVKGGHNGRMNWTRAQAKVYGVEWASGLQAEILEVSGKLEPPPRVQHREPELIASFCGILNALRWYFICCAIYWYCDGSVLYMLLLLLLLVYGTFLRTQGPFLSPFWKTFPGTYRVGNSFPGYQQPDILAFPCTALTPGLYRPYKAQ